LIGFSGGLLKQYRASWLVMREYYATLPGSSTSIDTVVLQSRRPYFLVHHPSTNLWIFRGDCEFALVLRPAANQNLSLVFSANFDFFCSRSKSNICNFVVNLLTLIRIYIFLLDYNYKIIKLILLYIYSLTILFNIK